MDDVAAPPAYIARANLLEQEAIWRLGPDALELQGGPTAGPNVVLRFPYRDIVGVRLSYGPSRVDLARYRCDLRCARAGRSRSYRPTMRGSPTSRTAPRPMLRPCAR